MVSGDVDAGHGMGDVFCQPMHAVGESAAQVPCHDADIGLGNCQLLPEVSIFEMQIGEQPDFHVIEPPWKSFAVRLLGEAFPHERLRRRTLSDRDLPAAGWLETLSVERFAKGLASRGDLNDVDEVNKRHDDRHVPGTGANQLRRAFPRSRNDGIEAVSSRAGWMSSRADGRECHNQ